MSRASMLSALSLSGSVPGRVRAALSLLVLIFLTLPALRAHAQASRVAVLGLQSDAEDERRVQVERELLAAVGACESTTADDRTDLTLTDALGFMGCSTASPDCLEQVADLLETPYLLYGTLRGDNGTNALTLTFFEARTRAIVFMVTLETPTRDAQGVLRGALIALLDGDALVHARPEPGVTLIAPPEARPLGETLWVVPPGEVIFRATREGARAQTLLVTAERSRIERLSTTAWRDTNTGSVRPLRIAGWSALGAGVALGAGAIVAGTRMRTVQDDYYAEFGQRRARELADEGEQKARLATGLFVTSGLTVAAGATMLLLDRLLERDDAPVRVGVGASSEGVSLDLGIRF